MFDFTNVSLNNLIIHNVGNKNNDEDLVISQNELILQEDVVREMLLKYFLSSFKAGDLYAFFHESEITLNEVFHFASTMFENPDMFKVQTVNIAKHLYEKSVHPRIKGGELYVALFDNCTFDGEPVQALGIFKSENKDTYLKIFQRNNEINVGYENGININKLDKGCLIFNTGKDEGYTVCIVDSTNKGEEALYWKNDFLKIKNREDEFFKTKNYLQMCKGFCEEVLTETNNVAKKDQMFVKNKTVEYFSKNDIFRAEQFASEILEAPEVIEAFNEYKQDFFKKSDLEDFDQFEISPQAIKSNKKDFKSVLKLDKNFSLYVHGGQNFLNKGYDEEKGMSYYKLFFNKES